MSIEFCMPSLGPDMESGTLVQWRVHAGDKVKHGDVVALVETDKGIIDVESFQDGVVEKLLIEPDTVVPVGKAIAMLSGEAPVHEVPAPTQVVAPVLAPATHVEPATVVTGEERQKISPAARVRAQALGIDISKIRGSGPNGVVTLQDVEQLKPTTAPSKPGAGMREIIAKAMARAKREIPHYYLSTTVDFGTARQWLTQHNASASITDRLLPAVLIVKAVAHALSDYSDFNGFYTAQGFKRASAINIGMAIAIRGGGLVAPALFDVNKKDLTTLMHELRDLSTRVRGGHMRSSELAESTITITSLGDEGVEALYPIIYPPQVAILGVGTIVDRPWVKDGAIEVRPVVNISLAADHRVTDGRSGAQFLARIRDRLQLPESL